MEGIYAKFETSKGAIVLQLTYKETPGTGWEFCEFSRGKSKKMSTKMRENLITMV
jgi:cyclophilin family peptidyl-prolyl cis-trans isomerase